MNAKVKATKTAPRAKPRTPAPAPACLHPVSELSIVDHGTWASACDNVISCSSCGCSVATGTDACLGVLLRLIKAISRGSDAVAGS